MKNDFFALYEALIDGVKCTEPVRNTLLGERWALVETETAAGMAMFTDGRSIEPMFPTMEDLPLCKAAEAVIDLHGLTVGIVGHMRGPAGLHAQAKAVYTLEREPREGDYPDSACDYLLPRCDLVLITGSALVNKTLPHLLELCEKATVILTGPSVPLCPALLDLGIDRIAGMAITDRAVLRERVEKGQRGSPYGEGSPFLLKKP